ncbi:PadR family transcriptional regulator [Brevibacillus sp. Leaf182]|uniref:PadR family transcriptional regulator n=1 Tax=Brevibacillus sp. Leaf182 TaxID=1736290 RepID=UPI0006F3F08C|nr:PadR family transcriptional regulator [Brevibacillus sp. Leaf182]RAT94094.1 PadR family transcriptional regulator [Brevibacillus sp. Leaf182]
MTRAMVLGLLLKSGPMSGYEIQQKMISAKTDKWAYVQPASIYHALKKLDQEGFVALETLEQTGNRSKAIYSITAEGKQELKRLLVNAFQNSSVLFPTDLYTALTFMDEAELDDIILALEKQQLAIQKVYEDLKADQEEKAKFMEMPQNVLYIFQNIYDQCELQLGFISKLKEDFLAQRQNASPINSI